MADRPTTVIIGGGIIGACSAYFMTRHPTFSRSTHRIVLLEAADIAGGASGKAGGLLALWAYPANIVPLSYKLHAELAAEHGGAERWGYRRVGCGQLEAEGRRISPKESVGGLGGPGGGQDDDKAAHVSLQKRSAAAMSKLRASGFPADLDWIAPDSATSYDAMGDPSTTAQVHPYQFTTSIAALAEAAGVEIRLGARVTSINPSKPGAVESVTYVADGKETTLPANKVVLAAGPWTQRLLPSAPISGLRAHSVTIRPTRDVSPYALFTEIRLLSKFRPGDKGSRTVAPEIYARPGREVYACGEGDTLVELPETTADVVTDPARCQDIIDYVGSVSDELRDGEVTVRQACYLPVCDGSGGPYIGEVGEMKGLILASGHSCWGIQNGPGTGKLVSEIVFDGQAKSAKLGALDPKVSF